VSKVSRERPDWRMRERLSSRKEGRREGGREGTKKRGKHTRTAPLQSPHFSATPSPVPSHWSHTTWVCMIPKAVRWTWEGREGGRKGEMEGGVGESRVAMVAHHLGLRDPEGRALDLEGGRKGGRYVRD